MSSTNGLLTRDEFTASASAKLLPWERVDLPEFGPGKYWIVQGMGGTERDAWEKSLIRGRGKKRDVDTENVRARLAVKTIKQPPDGFDASSGKGEAPRMPRMFQDSDAAMVGQARVDVVGRIYEVAQRLSGVSDEDADELERASAPADGNESHMTSLET
jgi:hypothetical protein